MLITSGKNAKAEEHEWKKIMRFHESRIRCIDIMIELVNGNTLQLRTCELRSRGTSWNVQEGNSNYG